MLKLELNVRDLLCPKCPAAENCGGVGQEGGLCEPFHRDDRVMHRDSGKLGRILGIAPRGNIALVKWDKVPKLHDVPMEHLLHHAERA